MAIPRLLPRFYKLEQAFAFYIGVVLLVGSIVSLIWIFGLWPKPTVLDPRFQVEVSCNVENAIHFDAEPTEELVRKLDLELRINQFGNRFRLQTNKKAIDELLSKTECVAITLLSNRKVERVTIEPFDLGGEVKATVSHSDDGSKSKIEFRLKSIAEFEPNNEFRADFKFIDGPLFTNVDFSGRTIRGTVLAQVVFNEVNDDENRPKFDVTSNTTLRFAIDHGETERFDAAPPSNTVSLSPSIVWTLNDGFFEYSIYGLDRTLRRIHDALILIASTVLGLAASAVLESLLSSSWIKILADREASISRPSTASNTVAIEPFRSVDGDLQQVKGIGPCNAAHLRAAGITTLELLALLSSPEIEALEERLKSIKRGTLEDWVEQARELRTI